MLGRCLRHLYIIQFLKIENNPCFVTQKKLFPREFPMLSIAKIRFYANDPYDDIISVIAIILSMTKMVRLLMLSFVLFSLSGCGQSGDLYLPSPATDHTTSPHHAH